MNRRTRLSLDVSEALKSALARIQANTDAGSLTEVIRRAVLTYDYLVSVEKGGGRVKVSEKGGETSNLKFL